MAEQRIVLHVGFLSKTYKHLYISAGEWSEWNHISSTSICERIFRRDYGWSCWWRGEILPASSIYCGFLKSLWQELMRNSKKRHRLGSPWLKLKILYCICKKNKSTKVVAMFCCFWGIDWGHQRLGGTIILGCHGTLKEHSCPVVSGICDGALLCRNICRTSSAHRG